MSSFHHYFCSGLSWLHPLLYPWDQEGEGESRECRRWDCWVKEGLYKNTLLYIMIYMYHLTVNPYLISTNKARGVLLFLLEYIHTTIAGHGERHKGMGEYKCVASTLLSCSSCKDEVIHWCSYGEKYSSSASCLLFTPSTDWFVYVELVMGERNLMESLSADYELLPMKNISENKFLLQKSHNKLLF